MSNLEHFVMPKRKTSLKKLVILGSISQEKSASLKRLPPAKSGLLGGGSGVQSVSRVQLCNPMDCSTPGFPILHYLQSLLKFMAIESVMLSNHLILCHPLLLLPPIFPSITVFSNESALHIRWLNYWSFNFSISPSNEYSGLISFRID